MMNLGAFSWRNTPWIKATRPQWRYALRNGIAMCLALTVAYYLNLDEPYWAMTSAAVEMPESKLSATVLPLSLFKSQSC